MVHALQTETCPVFTEAEKDRTTIIRDYVKADASIWAMFTGGKIDGMACCYWFFRPILQKNEQGIKTLVRVQKEKALRLIKEGLAKRDVDFFVDSLGEQTLVNLILKGGICTIFYAKFLKERAKENASIST